LRRHELGFLELVDKPSPEELSSYYETKYYQDERANYRKEYSDQELAVIESRIALRHAKIKELNVMGGVILVRYWTLVVVKDLCCAIFRSRAGA